VYKQASGRYITISTVQTEKGRERAGKKNGNKEGKETEGIQKTPSKTVQCCAAE